MKEVTNMEGYPKGLDDWLRRQDDWFTILYSSKREWIYVRGPSPYFLYENLRQYLKLSDDGYWGVDIDSEKIREDFCPAIEDISVAEFVKHKLKKLWRIIKLRFGYFDLEEEPFFGHLIDVMGDDEEED